MALRINGQPVQLAEPDAEIIIEIDNSDGSGDAQVRLTDTGQTDPAGRFRIRVSGDALTIERSSGAGWSGGASRIEINSTGVGFFGATPVAQQADFGAQTDNSAGAADDTVQAMPDPADAPASADALRDDLVANFVPAVRNNFAGLTAAINDIRAVLRNLGLMA